ncbi:MAG: hypothetical protein AAB536_01010 [Patescibacteria group bacterium]
MITIFLIHRFITSLVFTAVVETAILLLIFKFIWKKPALDYKSIIFAGLFASFATIPYVWFVFPYAYNWSPDASLVFSELFAFAVEAIFYRLFLKISWRTAFVASFCGNAASYFGGPFLRSYGIWIYW